MHLVYFEQLVFPSNFKIKLPGISNYNRFIKINEGKNETFIWITVNKFWLIIFLLMSLNNNSHLILAVDC